MKKTISKKDLIVIAIVFSVSYTIFSDWDNFKAGLMGASPVATFDADLPE